MPPVPENSAPPADPAVANDYDSFAEAYSAETEANLINGYYARPAILALAGDVAGRRILDAGCGSGPLFAALRDQGAIVTGIDASTKMLELARRRLGDDADLQVADLGSPLPFPDGAFNDVIASLVLHYLEDWGPALAELRRVLKPGGRLIVSVDHPFAVNLMHREAGRKPDYFATYNHTAEWTMGGQTALMSFWHRPLHAMTDAFTAAGFRIAVISEPGPAPTARELFPDELAAKPRFLCFLFFVLQASGVNAAAGAGRAGAGMSPSPRDDSPFASPTTSDWRLPALPGTGPSRKVLRPGHWAVLDPGRAGVLTRGGRVGRDCAGFWSCRGSRRSWCRRGSGPGSSPTCGSRPGGGRSKVEHSLERWSCRRSSCA